MDEVLFQEIQALQAKIAAAEKERDDWQKTSTFHYEIAREMVISMQRRLAQLIARAADPQALEKLMKRSGPRSNK